MIADECFPYALMFGEKDDKIVATLIDFQDSANSRPVSEIDASTDAAATLSWIRQTLEAFPCAMVNFGQGPEGAYEMNFRTDAFDTVGLVPPNLPLS